MKAELIPIEGGSPIPITKDVTVVGRREFCDIQIDHPSLSKRHCVLVKTEGLLVIRDLATTNGTKVKGQKIRWAALLPEDRIALGSVKFRVYLGPDEALTPSEAAARGIPAAVEIPMRTLPAPSTLAPPRPARPRPAPVASPVLIPSDEDMPIILDDDMPIILEDDDEEIIELD